VRIAGRAAASDFLPAGKRDPLAFAGSERAWQEALRAAGVTRDNLDFVELHDCFTIAELVMYEVMGLTPRGEGARAIAEGWVGPDGMLPVNPSGGLKSKGHPVGATGVSQHVLASMQLTGAFPGVQVPGARVAAVHNMGGLAVSNYVSVLTSE
jgi:acetyl-CoA C-acetyltransferase